MVLSGLVDGQMRLPADAIYPRVAASEWSRHQGLLADGAVVRMPFGGFLVLARVRDLICRLHSGKSFRTAYCHVSWLASA